VSHRVWFSLAAFGLAALAAAISYFNGDSIELAFFALVGLAASTQAWCVREPGNPWLMRTARVIALAWAAAAAWIGVLLVMYQSASRPPPGPEELYLGVTATVYHLAALYGGLVLVSIAAFGPRRWLDRAS